MAHNIHQNLLTGTYDMGVIEGSAPAWHRLGKIIPKTFAQDMAGAAGEVNGTFDIECIPFNYLNGAFAVVDKEKCLGQVVIRKDTGMPLSVVGNAWTGHQNSDSWKFLQVLLDTGKCHVQTVGVLGGGETVFTSLGLGGSYEIRKDDSVQNYYTHVIRHKVGSILSLISNVRAVCANTVAMAESSAKSKLRIRHSSDVTMNVKTACDIIDLENERFAADAATMQKLANVGFNQEDVAKYVIQVLCNEKEIKALNTPQTDDETTISKQKQRLISEVIAMANRGLGNNGSSLWDALNGVTQYLTHESGRSAETRMESLMLGANAKLLAKANEVALSYISA